jgi:3-deoxy-D-manno-octulosonic-acid transferase
MAPTCEKHRREILRCPALAPQGPPPIAATIRPVSLMSFNKKPDAATGTKVGVKLALFRALEWLSRQRGGGAAAVPAAAPPPAAAVRRGAARSLWLFVSTIGEVHAIEPFIERLRRELGDPPLTLISDRATYGDAYRRKFPEARVEQLDGSTAQVRALLARDPPRLLVVAEIPGLLHDAPCRFSFATQHAARSVGAPVVLVNGWLYGYAPPSRLDAIEKRLFARHYAAGFDLALVQTEAVRDALVAAGAAPTRVHVTGNIKFDAMQPASAQVLSAPLPAALAARAAAGRGPVLVAGSVTETEHQRAVLDAFVQLRRSEPQALLVLAPRHPEHTPYMAVLRTMLEASGFDFRYRSQCSPDDAVAGDVLVLDTMGELRGCYAAADAAFVGVDHNVLEPLAYGKPVFVGSGWEPTYPSYPVYRRMLEAGALVAVARLDELGTAWQQHFAQPPATSGNQRSRIESALAEARGSVELHLQALRRAGFIPTPSEP